jgi:hypothetical protein
MDEDSSGFDLGGLLNDATGAYAAYTNAQLAAQRAQTPAQATVPNGSATSPAVVTSSGTMSKWLIWGVAALVFGVVLYLMLRKK